MSNYQGNYVCTVENDMRAFDKLPPVVRAAIRDSHENYAAAPLLTSVRRGTSADVVAGRVSGWSRASVDEHWYRMHRLAEKGTPYFAPVRRKRVRQ